MKFFKHSLIVVALSTVTATSLAMMDTEYVPPPSGTIGSVGLGDVLPRMGSGGVSLVDLPQVTLACGSMCRAQGAVIFHPNGNDKIFVGGGGPLAVDPRQGSGGVADTPAQQEEKKRQCLANCATQDTVNKNNCTISNTQFRAKMATVPIWAGVAGGLVGGILFKGAGTVGGIIGGAMLAAADIESRVKDQMQFCLAVAANDNNNCIKKICHAWFFAPFLLAARRRRRENEDDQPVRAFV